MLEHDMDIELQFTNKLDAEQQALEEQYLKSTNITLPQSGEVAVVSLADEVEERYSFYGNVFYRDKEDDSKIMCTVIFAKGDESKLECSDVNDLAEVLKFPRTMREFPSYM